jgi:hypothetical protein
MGARFRELLRRREPFEAIAACDVFTARMVEEMGYPYDALTELKTTGTMAKASGGVRLGGRIPPDFRARLLRTNDIAERGKKYNAG